MGAQVATGWQAIPWQAIAVVVAALIGGAVTIVVFLASHSTAQGDKTRAAIDALAASLGARVDRLQTDLESTRRDVARLGERVGTFPARVVDDDDCRERHEQLREEVLSLAHGRRLVITGSGGGQ